MLRTSVIVPCWNEEAVIADCLRAVIADVGTYGPSGTEIVVVANACTDGTAYAARALVADAWAAGVALRVVETPVPGKSGALTLGDTWARGAVRIYLDADVRIAPGTIGDLTRALSGDRPHYATGTLRIPRAKSRISRAYARVWRQLPFVAEAGSGCGLYAVNGAGRRRWGAFPGIHSDDKFVRSLFSPSERTEVLATYDWPVPDGALSLIRVRRRWCEGNAEFRRRYPELIANGRHRSAVLPLLRIAATRPLDVLVFAGIYLTAAAQAAMGDRAGARVIWRRGRA